MRLVACYLAVIALASTQVFSQQLEIHYINVGWGSSVFVKGPDGTTILLEAGENGMGTERVIPYLTSIGVLPQTGLDYVIAGHQHCDHIGGLDEVVNGGYSVRKKNFYNGSTYGATSSTSCAGKWRTAALTTAAGAPVLMNPGTEIALGSGAKLICIASNGNILGGGTVAVSNENDRSIAVLIRYGGFDYIWASDMGGGNIDESCTNRHTDSQIDVETSVIEAISPGGVHPLISAEGIDVLNVNHHGSESSTNKHWMNLARPAVAIIATGAGQTTGWDLPRKDVVENVLHAEADCITVPEALVLQTEEGNPTGSNTSYAGYCVGNIKIVTDGVSTFTVSADGQVSQGPNELQASGLPRTFSLDDVTQPTLPPLLLSAIRVMIEPDNRTRISWQTNRNATSRVDYGLASDYTSSVSDPASATDHDVVIEGLEPGRRYHYRIQSTGPAGLVASSADSMFDTRGGRSYHVDSVTVLRGALEAGTIASLNVNDAQTLTIKSTLSEPNRYTDWYASAQLAGPYDEITSLTCSYAGRYSRGGISQRVYLFNWRTRRWNQMGTVLRVGQQTQSVRIARHMPGDYISPAGAIRFRVRGTKEDNRSFKCIANFLKFEAGMAD